ncbi:hypothetical protein Psfp_01138 [Pelotomaculum sp. FP]|uniref:hypothetical protein n=1 Tax=Pelotomaculum sp. FP TaxID=261474 RepID=UPI0010664895|nr:hypothetical protein [Pelotomaculum sp. FP]TEB16737.1 hypothetical protein Psfp_01138 [Pelotomaculum sp. FP]
MKMKRMLLYFIFSLALCFIVQGLLFAERSIAASAQTPEVEWANTFERGEAHFVEQTKDGGYVVSGWIEAGQEGPDVFLARYDGGGNRLWLKTYRGNGYNDSHCVKETSEGGFIIAGETKSRHGYDHDVYVVRTDEKGEMIWEKEFGGERCDYVWSVQQTKDGGFIIAGGTESCGAGIYDVYLIKLDLNGNEIWEKTYGGAGSDCGYAVLQLADGGYLVAGNAESFGAGNPDLYLLKTDGDGKMLWQKTYGGKGSDYGWSLVKAGDGGFLIAGEKEITGDRGGGFAAVLIKVDPDGNELWENTYGNNSVSSFYSVSQAKDGGYILTGKKESAEGGYDLYVVRTDKNGGLAWEKTVDGTGGNSGYAVLQSKDGGYIVAGEKGIEKSAGSEIFLLKLKSERNPIGGLVWLIGAAAVILIISLLIYRKSLPKKAGLFRKENVV